MAGSGGGGGAGQTSVCPAGWIASVRGSGKMSVGEGETVRGVPETKQFQPHQLKRVKTLLPTDQ